MPWCVEPTVFLSNQSWHTGWEKKIKLFYNYGYLLEFAFVIAAGVLETSVSKYLYIFSDLFCILEMFLPISVPHPGHSCEQACVPVH